MEFLERILLLIVVSIIVSFVLFYLPISRVVVNARRLFRERPQNYKDFIADIVNLIFGYLFACVFIPHTDWREGITEDLVFHSPIAMVDHGDAISLFSWVAFSGYFLLLLLRQKMPPLIKVVCLSGVYLGCLFCVVWIVQLLPNFYAPEAVGEFQTQTMIGLVSGGGFYPIVLLCTLFAFNYLLSAAVLVQRMVAEQSEQEPKLYRSRLLMCCQKMLLQSRNQPIAAAILLIPLYGCCVLILVLLGQQPDAAIRLFTDTSDWFFSTRISPPTTPYQGHYLCTVAARGHRKLVRPLRKGIRGGCPIMVNRQLCIANAFEELLSDRVPSLHRFIRRNYDTYGLPVCRYIETPWKSDLVYLLMKPAEWLFLLVLYTFDLRPEQRIARQYLPADEG